MASSRSICSTDSASTSKTVQTLIWNQFLTTSTLHWLQVNVPGRKGSFNSFENDSGVMDEMSPNRPIYKPEQWEVVRDVDLNGNRTDPSRQCWGNGVPPVGPPRLDPLGAPRLPAGAGGTFPAAGLLFAIHHVTRAAPAAQGARQRDLEEV